MIQINLLLLLLVVVVSLVTVVESMRFELESGIIKCITEDVNNDAMTVGKYTIVNPRESESENENENENDALPLPHTHKIDVKVTSPSGQVFHHGDSVDSGNFAFTTNEAGHYMICFWPANHQPPVTFSIDFDWKFGVAAKDWSKVAKKTQIQVMELELRKLYDTVTSIHQEMFYLRGREEEMQQLNRATNSKMATLSFLSLLVCLSVAGTQLWHLKAFFERKKLL